jgi:hypothetical protein
MLMNALPYPPRRRALAERVGHWGCAEPNHAAGESDG